MDFNGALAVSSAAIAAITAFGIWLASFLTRKSAKEDNRRAENDQAWDQLIQLSEVRAAEIVRMGAAAIVQRTEYEDRIARMQADYEARDRRRSAWCRKVTDTLVNALRECRAHSATPEPEADHAIRLAESHREHHGDDDDAYEDERRSEGRS